MRKLSVGSGWVVLVVIGLLASPVGAQFVQTNLVSDGAVPAARTDANLVNAWGIAHDPAGPLFIADNGTAVSTAYFGTVAPFPSAAHPLVITVFPADSAAPSGIVFNDTSGFMVREGRRSGRSEFIYVSEDGTISAWSPKVSRQHTIVAFDNSASGAVYKGVALGMTHPNNGHHGDNHGQVRLFAANFNAGVVDVFDQKFHFLSSFTDPDVDAGYAPFGIRNIHGQLYVTFALQDGDKHDDVKGPGHGFVDIFNTNGQLVRRLISHEPLNSPWGLELAPRDFGPFGGALLVGNFGDGNIHAFDPDDGTLLGTLNDTSDAPIVIDGLWGLDFGNGFLAGPRDTLFFTAGPNGEANGLFGKLEVAP